MEPISDKQSQEILDAALEMGLESGWDSVRLFDVSSRLGISLAYINLHYRQKDDLVEALFDRADHALLSIEHFGSEDGTVSERLHQVMFTWFDALASYHALIPSMLGYKLEPLHFHLQAQGITRISRTVQWFMEAAGITTSNPIRVLEEFGLTGIYLATFARWINDSSENQQQSRRFLRRQLELASRLRSNQGKT